MSYLFLSPQKIIAHRLHYSINFNLYDFHKVNKHFHATLLRRISKFSLVFPIHWRQCSTPVPQCIPCSGGWPLRCFPWCLSWRERRRRPASSGWHLPSDGSGCRRPRTARPPESTETHTSLINVPQGQACKRPCSLVHAHTNAREKLLH